MNVCMRRAAQEPEERQTGRAKTLRWQWKEREKVKDECVLTRVVTLTADMKMLGEKIQSMAGKHTKQKMVAPPIRISITQPTGGKKEVNEVKWEVGGQVNSGGELSDVVVML